MAIYWKTLFLRKRNDPDNIVCEYTVRLSSSDYDYISIITQLGIITADDPHRMSDEDKANVAEYMGTGYQQIFTPSHVTSGSVTGDAAASETFTELLSIMPANNVTVCTLDASSDYLLCADPDQWDNNYYVIRWESNASRITELKTSDGITVTTPDLWWGVAPLLVAGYEDLARCGIMCISSDNRLVSFLCGFGSEEYNVAYNSLSEVNTEFFIQILNSAKPAKKDDPYKPGGESTQNGGNGTFDGSSTPVDIPELPTLGALNAGFITLFNPSLAQLRNLASFMWDPVSFDVSTWQKLFVDPMDAILGLAIVPVAPPTSGGVVKVGNISTGVSMPEVTSQYVEVDCGSLNIQEFWGAYLDYSPYTKVELYLPYIGTHAIEVDDVMKKTVTIKYHVDVLSGACTVYVKCGDTVLYTFIGQCAASVPVAGRDYTNMINGVLSIAGSVGMMAASGGASAMSGVANVAATATNMIKPNIEKSGAMSGVGGMLAVQVPYLIITRPKQALPANQNRYMGYPSFITSSLEAISGYTEVESIHLENMSCTDTELNEIENLLRGGVIL